MIPDYHIHTVLCRHATGEIADYKRQAEKCGLPEICITDHAPAPDGYDFKHRMLLSEYKTYCDSVAAVRNEAVPRVLFGIEADYYHGGLGFLQQWLPEQAFDLIIGSVHYIGQWGFDNPDERAVWESVDVAHAWRTYFQLIRELALTCLFDVVGHLDLPKKFGFRPADKTLREMAQPALDAVATAGMTIEINTSGLRKPVKEIYPSPLLLSLARERDIGICFGSDSHQPMEVGYEFQAAVRLAKEAGYSQSVRFSKRQQQRISLP